MLLVIGYCVFSWPEFYVRKKNGLANAQLEKLITFFFSLFQVDKKHKKKSRIAATGLQRKQVFRAIAPTHVSKKLT